MRAPPTLLLLSLLACSKPLAERPEAASPGAATAPRAPLALDHDFGTVPHGEQRTHEFPLDLDALGAAYVPLRVHLECSCGRADVRLRAPDGAERYVDGTPMAHNLPAEGEQAILHVELDTQKKAAVDLPATVSRGYVLLQPLDDPNGTARLRWPFVVRFAIDAPVVLQPFAALSFGRVPRSSSGEVLTTLRGDEAHPEMTFRNPRSTDDGLEVALEPDEGRWILRARVDPGEPGSYRALVVIDTSLEGYRVALEAAWKVVPDLEVVPMAKISFTTDLGAPQNEEDEMRQFVLVTDHDRDRSPEFAVAGVVGADGNDASSHFAVSVLPMPGRERQQRLRVRYLGGLDSAFRGRILLEKPDDGARLPIDLVVFPSR